MACSLCRLACGKSADWYHVRTSDEGDAWQFWICPSCCRTITRDMEKEKKQDPTSSVPFSFHQEARWQVQMTQTRAGRCPSFLAETPAKDDSMLD